MPTIEILGSDRVAIFGQTGSGKTYLSKYLLRRRKRLVAIDPKGMLRGQWGLDEWHEGTRKALLDGSPVRVRIPAPLDGVWDDVLWDVYNAGNCTLYIDEMYGVVPIGKRSPIPLNAIYTRGRELGVGVIAVSQRPVWIPKEMISESGWFICFRLLLESDRASVAEIMGPEVMVKIPDRYGFWIMAADWDGPVYTAQLEVGRSSESARSRVEV